MVVLHHVPMEEDEWAEYTAWLVDDYAADLRRADALGERDADAKAREEVFGLLPDGLSTERHEFFSLRDESGRSVGRLWVADMERDGRRFLFLCDVVVFPEHRRRGYGTAALRVAADRARELGIDVVVLHVFAHNEAALALYRAAGYRPLEERPGHVTMAKQLDPED